MEWKSVVILTGSALAMVGVAIGLYFAMRSPLFILRVVEVADLPENAPVDAQVLTELVDVPLGKWNLFLLDLGPVERRLRAHPWIREASLQKRFPQTLSVSVTFRQPSALLQSERGKLSYLDRTGESFGQVSLSRQPDLPLITGIPAQERDRLQQSLRLLERWEASAVGKLAQVSSLDFDAEQGFRVWVTYPLLPSLKNPDPSRGRATVNLGEEPAAELEAQLARLETVFSHLSKNAIAARQIWADSGKKVVVRFTRGS
jgi:hypothetical protein